MIIDVSIIWTTKDGKKLKIKDMSTQHLINIADAIYRKSKYGMLSGGLSGSMSTAEDMEALADSIYKIYGNEVLNKYPYYSVIHELINREKKDNKVYVDYLHRHKYLMALSHNNIMSKSNNK